MIWQTKGKCENWHRIAWWLCVVTLPWADQVNTACLVLLTIVWIAEGDFKLKWQRLKAATWSWPFLFYYFLLMAGILYTQDAENGFFMLEKKITIFMLPVIAATGRQVDEKFGGILKRSFVYSCSIVVLLCLAGASYSYFLSNPIANFDIRSNANFMSLHPGVSPAWMYFSYIQLASWMGIHPGYLSMYLVFCLVILFTESYHSRMEQRIHVFIGLVIVGFLILLATRMAIVAFICSSVYLSIKKTQEKQIKAILPLLSVVLIGIILAWLNPVAKFRLIEEPMGTTYHLDRGITNWNSVSFRLLEWQGSWSVIRAHWFAGVGKGGGKNALDNFYAHYNSSTVDLGLNAHNQYLQTWMESGLLGALTFLLCLTIGLFKLGNNLGYVSFILIFSLMCLTESIGERQKGIVFFMLFQVLFLGLIKSAK